MIDGITTLKNVSDLFVISIPKQKKTERYNY